MRRCLDKGDVSALHSGAILWVPDSVKLALLAIVAHPLFPVRGVGFSGVLDVHEGSDSDDAKVQEVGFLADKHLEWRLLLERLLRSPVVEVRGRPERLPPHGRWEASVCEHVPNHGAQSPPHAFKHAKVLWCVGGDEIFDNAGLQAVLPEVLPGVLAARVGTPTNDVTTEGDSRLPDEQWKRLKSLLCVCQQIDGDPLRVLVGYLADVLISTYSNWRERPHQVPVAQPERPVDPVVGCLEVSKLLSLSRGTNVAVRGSSLKYDTNTISLA